MSESVDALVIGAGPAGLMAAEELARAGRQVVIVDAMPTPARKFLMAGKSGLNLTKDESLDDFRRWIAMGEDGPTPALMLDDFGPAQITEWARGLGIGLFTGSTGRVFPTGMKASPLLRAWLARLHAQGVEMRTRWRWQGFQGNDFTFATPDRTQLVRPAVTVLALGGASWPRLGSDAAWVPWLQAAGVDIAPFRPANMGFRVNWSAPMQRHFGAAVKGVAVTAGDQTSRGEWVISQRGIEGGGIYALSAAMRDGTAATLDLAPDLTADELATRLHQAQGRQSIGNRLRRVLGDPVKAALLLEWDRPLPDDLAALAASAKILPVDHAGPMDLDGAISSAGGIKWASVTKTLSLRARPRIYVAGEMLDWEAPTGGYLLSVCLATGRFAGRMAASHPRSVEQTA